MQSIINSILKNRNLIIYITLSLITFNSLYTNSSIHYNAIGKTGAYLSGKTSIFSSYINSYFNLRDKNQIGELERLIQSDQSYESLVKKNPDLIVCNVRKDFCGALSSKKNYFLYVY